MFEKATRMKLRWSFRGLCSVEDLWDLTVEDLDDIYKGLRRKQKAQEDESLLTIRSDGDKELTLKVDIVKYIVETKLTEAQERKEAAERKAKKQKIMAVIAQKQDEQLMGMDIGELKGMLDEL
jgi:chemotaxis signal transduction protein